MSNKHIHLIYFSPTHTSVKIAHAVAKGLNAGEITEWDVTHGTETETVLIEDGIAIMAAPVYGGRVAEKAVERLRIFKAKGIPVIPVVLYGNRDYEDALKELCDLATEQGFIPVAGGAFIGEHSFSRKNMPIAEGRPDSEDLSKAIQFGKDVLEKLEKRDLSEIPSLTVKGNFPYKVKGPSTPQAPVTDEILCTQCEYCMEVCPTEAISVAENGMESDPALCIKCCVCVKECPESARTFDTPFTAMLHTNFSARKEPEVFL